MIVSLFTSLVFFLINALVLFHLPHSVDVVKFFFLRVSSPFCSLCQNLKLFWCVVWIVALLRCWTTCGIFTVSPLGFRGPNIKWLWRHQVGVWRLSCWADVQHTTLQTEMLTQHVCVWPLNIKTIEVSNVWLVVGHLWLHNNLQNMMN